MFHVGVAREVGAFSTCQSVRFRPSALALLAVRLSAKLSVSSKVDGLLRRSRPNSDGPQRNPPRSSLTVFDPSVDRKPPDSSGRYEMYSLKFGAPGNRT